jgi:hypothetical protein
MTDFKKVAQEVNNAYETTYTESGLVAALREVVYQLQYFDWLEMRTRQLEKKPNAFVRRMQNKNHPDTPLKILGINWDFRPTLYSHLL